MISRLSQKLAETGRSARDVSLAASGKPDTIRNILRGSTRSPKAATLERIAAELGTTSAWLMGNARDMPAPSPARPVPKPQAMATIKVFGLAAGALAGHHSMTNDPIDEVDAPETLRHVVGAYALLTRGESMIPRYFPNDRLYVNPHQAVRPGDHVIVQTRLHDNSGTETWVKRYDGETSDEIIVSQYNPPAQMRFKKRYVSFVHRVLPVNELFRR